MTAVYEDFDNWKDWVNYVPKVKKSSFEKAAEFANELASKRKELKDART